MGKNRRSSDDDSDFEDVSPSKRQRGPPKTTPPLYKAEVIETADSASVRVSSSTADLDEGVLIRMKKCLTRANHPETQQADEQARLDRLKDLHVSVEDEDEAVLVNKTAVTPERLQTPEPQVSSALQDIRDMYPSSPESSASDEYEYEEWNGFSDDDGDDEPNESGIDYCAADFDDDDEDDEEYYMPDNDVDDEIDLLAAAMKRSSSPEPKTPPPFRSNDRGVAADATSDTRRDSVEPQAETTDDDPKWKSHMQLIQFRETTEKIAEDYLTDQGIKLHKGRKRSGVKDWAAFKKGQKDSKKIDVRRKNIMAHSKDEQEQAGSLLMALD
ncbi:hypothetical protein PRZ48_010437 [Zasmidium cellare]|uniref:Uncharacterized protein n=1 Tax=Zasmidium cellare TaxID=395010 RepID=A0ABR0E8M9_ZASCE|nr:hypothetical protein PRZ48_010437 [Zasmidium cellare]